jgi:predicted acylesterase/phospholipase RssA
MANEGSKRKLAAILGADVEGYRRLMRDDEDSTIHTLTNYRPPTSNLIQKFRGHVMDAIGDNLSAEFMIRQLPKLALVLFLLVYVSGCTKMVHGPTPGTLRTSILSEGLKAMPSSGGDYDKEFLTTDRYSDLLGRKKILGVSLSGGGARAAYFASNVLRDIEEAYQPNSFYKEISFYSSVSGGSIVNAYIGAWMFANQIHNRDFLRQPCEADSLDFNSMEGKPFYWIHNFIKGDGEDSKSCGNLGDIATQAIFDPMNLGLPIIYSFFTNQGYSLYLTQSGEYCLQYLLSKNGVTHYRSTYETAKGFMGSFIVRTNHSSFKLSDLGGFEGSRHYINATILETGQRLVFANEKYHIHSRDGLRQRLNDIVFLEDLYRSVEEFSVADAMFASMSFPGATDPVVFDVYDGVDTKDDSPRSIAQIQIVDGGVFDNTGLATLLDIMFDEVIVTDAKSQELIILMIDSDNSESKTLEQIIKESSDLNNSATSRSSKGINLPIIKKISVGIKSALLIYELNKRNTIRLIFYEAYKKLKEFNSNGRDISLKILPISIECLTDDLELKEVQNIKTYYSISRDAIKKIEKAVGNLMETEYSDSLKIFKRKYFLPHDSYVDTILYQPDTSLSMQDTIVNAITID